MKVAINMGSNFQNGHNNGGNSRGDGRNRRTFRNNRKGRIGTESFSNSSTVVVIGVEVRVWNWL